MEFEKILAGIVRYINIEIFPAMTDWQEMLARIAVSRVAGNAEALKNAILGNSFLRTFAVIGPDGSIDADGILRDLKGQIEAMGSFKLKLPLMPLMTFTGADVDKLRAYIEGGRG